jgi:hypothetical protein
MPNRPSPASDTKGTLEGAYEYNGAPCIQKNSLTKIE